MGERDSRVIRFTQQSTDRRTLKEYFRRTDSLYRSRECVYASQNSQKEEGFLVSLLHRKALPWFYFTTKEHEENSLTPTPQARNSARIRKVLFVHSKDRSLRSDPK